MGYHREEMEKRGVSLSITENVPRSALLDFVACISSASFALFWVVLRIASRFNSRSKLRFNDYAILWAMFWGIFLAINSIVTVTYGGIGHHMSEIMALAPQRLQPMLKTVLIGQFTWALSNTGVKLSIIDLYVKLFGINRGFRLISYCVMGAVSAYCLMVILIAFFLCRPLAFNWEPTIPGGHCGDQRSAFLASGVLNLILDVTVLALPLPMLWSLKMAPHKKVGLTFIFSVGVGICGITIWRMIILRNLDAQDMFYEMGYLSTATNLEPLLGICVACLPVCRPLLIGFRQKMRDIRSSVLNRVGITSELPYEPQHLDSLVRNRDMSTKPIPLSARKKFHRLDDNTYEMAGLESITRCEGSGNGGSLERVAGGYCTEGIKVTETWDITTERRT